MTPEVVTRADVGLALAEAVLSGVRDAAAERGLAMGAAVLDRGGQIVSAMRMDGAQICAVPLALDKAYTAVAVGAPTDAWAGSTQPGGADWGFNTTLGGRIVVLAGGLPIVHDGEVIGGLGVSGGAGADDLACAQAGLEAAGLKVAPES
jgi:uncharacterized protein GlcG (DUF336 family)